MEAKITVSMGGAFFPEDATDKFKLIKKADQALYRAKEAGRDRFEYDFELQKKAPPIRIGLVHNVDDYRKSKTRSYN
jgi:predicted signal transduction protein with EAL and GGDEF domain